MNTLAHFWTLKAFLPEMIKQKKGHIVMFMYHIYESSMLTHLLDQRVVCRWYGWTSDAMRRYKFLCEMVLWRHDGLLFP